MSMFRHSPPIPKLTVRGAPLLVLKRVAVITRRLRGSTAPTATSGVSTTPTSFGGAVSTAARPKCMGEPGPADGLTGAMGVEGWERFKDSRPFVPPVDVNELWDRARELRRPGVTNEVARESDDTVRGAGLGVNPREECPVAPCGVRSKGPLLLPFCFPPSSSVHCRCKMMDFVAHYIVD